MIYEINMSKGVNIRIDEEDLQKIKDNLSSSLIIVKQAIINPSFMISITPTEEQDIVIRPKVLVENGVAKIIGEDKVSVLANNMNIGDAFKVK